MATYTTNLNLKKPAQSDKIRIADINNNMDDIDAAFGAVGTESMAAQLGAIQDSIAIVATGNAHAAISAGQFVFVKNHETLDTGLYVATSNISQNGTLSSGNLTADNEGGLNALSEKINGEIVTVAANQDYQLIRYSGHKVSKIVVLFAEFTLTSNENVWNDIGTVNFNPTSIIEAPGVKTSNGSFAGMIQITTSGTIRFYPIVSFTSQTVALNLSFMTND